MMTRRALLTAPLGALALPAFAQVEASAIDLFFDENRYLPYFLDLQSRNDPGLDQVAALVGDERRALRSAANKLAGSLQDTARAMDAIPAIIEASRGKKVVILNEAHVASRHRHFLVRLLRALRSEGFTHFAAETFLNDEADDAPAIGRFKAGDPFDPNLGFYTRDPVFAEAVREAADLGYTFLSYEMRNDQAGSSSPGGAQAIATREAAQAKNLISRMQRLAPDARLLVHVGYAHLREKPDAGGNSWFALRLAEGLGLDPLTVTQCFTGSFAPAPDGALTREVLARFSPDDSIVVMQDGVSIGSESTAADLAIFHPALSEAAGRPGWLMRDPMRRTCTISLAGLAVSPPFLVQAIHSHEGDIAVPADQVLVEAMREDVTLALRHGHYRWRIETRDGLVAGADLTV